MVIALASWAMLFASLFLAYVVLRVEQVAWPPPGSARLPVPLAGASTAVLLASSGVLAAAQRRHRAGDRAGLVSRLWITLGLGVGFLALQSGVWWQARQAGLEVSGVLGSVLYALSGLHALHVLGGLAALAWLLFRVRRGPLAAGRGSPVVLVALFWHFLDLVWVAMFLAIFVF
jgi:cytochrome c oxidase subunit 3